MFLARLPCSCLCCSISTCLSVLRLIVPPFIEDVLILNDELHLTVSNDVSIRDTRDG